MTRTVRMKGFCNSFSYVPRYFVYGSVRQHRECILSQPPLCNACPSRALTTAFHQRRRSRREPILTFTRSFSPLRTTSTFPSVATPVKPAGSTLPVVAMSSEVPSSQPPMNLQFGNSETTGSSQSFSGFAAGSVQFHCK